MISLKTFCLLFLFAGLFINCSQAQNKTVAVPMTPIAQPSSATFNTETQRFESIGGGFTIKIPQAPAQTRDLGTETANKKRHRCWKNVFLAGWKDDLYYYV